MHCLEALVLQQFLLPRLLQALPHREAGWNLLAQ